MNSIDKRNNVKTDYDLIAKQYGEEFGNYIEDLNIYEEFISIAVRVRHHVECC